MSAKLGPFTYNPIFPGTFSSKAADKSIVNYAFIQPISRWSHGAIEIRKGLRSQYKDPSPSEYNTVHQWVKSGEKDKKIGNFNLMNRVSTARSFSVYHWQLLIINKLKCCISILISITSFIQNHLNFLLYSYLISH